jgi:alkylation response protein AidB-like acyl-CoA dehydrogenase
MGIMSTDLREAGLSDDVGQHLDERRDALAAVAQLAPILSARSGEGEVLRTMPQDLVALVKSNGLFRLALPRALGGRELDPLTLVEVVETLARADGSAAWTILIGNATSFFAWLEPDVAAAMIDGDVEFCSTGMFAPYGQAHADGRGAYVVSGRWPFNSGCPHAEWLQVGVMVMDGSAPRLRDDAAGPDWRFAFVPASAASIEDTWHGLGLRGTGSHHLSLDSVRVPDVQLAAPVYEPAKHPGPLWRLGLFDLAAVFMCGLPLGIARHALDEFIALARTKFRSNPSDTVAGNGHVQMLVSQAESRHRAARLYVYDVVSRVWDTCLAGDGPNPELKAELAMAACHAMRASLDSMDSLYRLAGAEAIYQGHPLERCFRDLHTASSHLVFSATREQEFARRVLGVAGE